MTPSLPHTVALVAGASRGVGRGVARGLGEAGASVVVSARSSEAGPRTDQRRETIEDTAREIIAAGGRGYPYVCDHTDARAVDALTAWTLRRFGRIDVAVCAVWGGNEGYDGARYPDGSAWGDSFWRRPAARLGTVLGASLLPALLLARAVAPAMVAARRGLVVFIGFDADGAPLGDLHHDLAIASLNRLAVACAAELTPHGVTALALSPGRVATERARDLGIEGGESPLYAGRAVAALAADPDVARHGGRTLAVADLARAYGFTDQDGSQPERFFPDRG